MVIALVYYLFLIVLGVLCLPLTRALFSGFRDKGYPFAKIIFQLAISFLALNIFYWFYVILNLSYLLKIRFGIFALVICTLIIVFVNYAFFYQSNTKITKDELKIFVKEELLFALLFVAMLAFRGAQPQIEGIEKFMDFAIINGLNRSESIPPQDVWFSGFEINYYYFGHLGVSILNQLSGIDSAVFYNLYVATLFAMVGTAAFSIIYHLTHKYIAAVVSSLVLLIGGNLDFFYYKVVMQADNYFYAQARSLIPNTINEFPAYSFLIGDLHAHILNIPYVLLFLALCFSIYSSHSADFDKKWLFLPLSFGALGATNSWDWFIYLPVLGVLVLSVLSRQFDNKIVLKKSVIYGSLLVAFSILLYLPFYLNFSPPSGGVGFTWPKNDLLAIFKMFGFFAVVVVFFLITGVKNSFHKTNKFVLFLIFFGMLLVFLPETFFVKDIYYKLNPPYYRANTVFKIWYQAWIILTIVGAYCFVRASQAFKRPLHLVLSISPVLILLGFVFAYSVTSVRYIIGPKYVFKGLDGSQYLKEKDIGAKSVIAWINENVEGQPILLEAPGRPYSMDSIVSSYTGLPTVIGWTEHELGWRGEWEPIANRMGDVEKIYTSTSLIEVTYLLKKYNVEYAVIGTSEKTKYGFDTGVALRALTTYVAGDDNTTLLRVKDL